MTATNAVRRALHSSHRYHVAIRDLPLVGLAHEPIMRPEEWTDEERQNAILWAAHETDEMPKPMREYIARVRARAKECS